MGDYCWCGEPVILTDDFELRCKRNPHHWVPGTPVVS